MVIEGMDLIDEILACVASFSIWFRAKKDRGKGFVVLTTQEMKREPRNEGGGGGGGGEGRKCLLGLATGKILTCVDERYVSY